MNKTNILQINIKSTSLIFSTLTNREKITSSLQMQRKLFMVLKLHKYANEEINS